MTARTRFPLIACIVLAGCSLTQPHDTPESAYQQADREYRAAVATAKLLIKTEVITDPAVIEVIEIAATTADGVLDAWGEALENGQPFDGEAAFWTALDVLIEALPEDDDGA